MREEERFNMDNVINKANLVDVIAEQRGTTKKSAREMIDAVTGAIISALKNKKEVRLTGFGIFTPKFVPEHKQVLGFSGEEITVPEHYNYKVKLSKKALA